MERSLYMCPREYTGKQKDGTNEVDKKTYIERAELQ